MELGEVLYQDYLSSRTNNFQPKGKVKSVNTNKVEMDKKAAIAVVFENPEFGKIRTLTDENGEPLFCAKDLCDILGYKKSRNAVNQLVNHLDALKQGVKVSGSLRKDGSRTVRTQQMIFVNESGFYALVLGSKLPTAVKFKNWVTADVLPQIRKTGCYIPEQQGESDTSIIFVFVPSETHIASSACRIPQKLSPYAL